MLVFLVWIYGFLKDLDVLFFGIGSFRLLIQRCKNLTGWGSLFDQGEDWPDESEICPTNGFLWGWTACGVVAAGRKQRRPRAACPKGNHKTFCGGGLFWAVVPRRKIKPPRVFSAAAIFLSGPTMFQAFSGNLDVINWTDFTFTSPGFCPWHLQGFSGSGFEFCYTVQMVLHLVFRDTG
jgi:hypothetical protein